MSAATEPRDAFAEGILTTADALYATGRRDTPTATIIARLDPQGDRELWLTLRRTGIGSSDMGAVLGMSRYRSELDVWADKVAETPLDSDDAGEAALWGNLLEDIVAREWARRHDVTVRRVGTVAHVEHRHMLCDLDRLVVGCPHHDRCALEVKTRSAFKADEWRDGAVPEDVEAQVMHQLAVTGLDAIHVTGLIGGQRLESRTIVPDPDYIADLFTIGDQFWTENVQAGVPPAISSLDLLVDHLSRLAPDKGVPVVVDGAELADVKHLTRIIREGKRAEAAADEAKAKLKTMIGENGTDLTDDDGNAWWTWRAQNKARRLDEAAVAEALGVDDLTPWKTSSGTTRVLREGAAAKALTDDEADQ